MALLISLTGLSERQLLDDCDPLVIDEILRLAAEDKLPRRLF